MEDEGLSENMAYTRGVTDNLKYSKNRVDTIRALVPETEDRLSYYIDLFKYHTNWKMFAFSSEWKNWRYEKKSELKGFQIKDEVGPTARPEAGGAEGELPIPAEQETCLRDLLQYLQENNYRHYLLFLLMARAWRSSRCSIIWQESWKKRVIVS